MSLMEQAILNAPTFLAEGWLSLWFFRAFLNLKHGDRGIRPVWTTVYFLPTMLLFLLMDNTHPLAGVLWVAERLIPLLLLQSVFFCFDPRKLLFLIISFLSGVYLLRYMITVLYVACMDGVLDFFYRRSMQMDLSTTQSAEEQLAFWQNALHLSQLGVMLLTTVLYIVLLWYYLRLLKSSFQRKDLPLTKRETLLLVLPCLTAVTASFFIRMVIVGDGETPNLFYSKPWSRLFVPLVSALLLASIVAAVKLLQAELDYRESLKQQTLLDAQIRQMRTEIAQVQDLREQMRGFRHDLRGHLANIAAYVRKMETDQDTGIECAKMVTVGRMERNLKNEDGNAEQDKKARDTRGIGAGYDASELAQYISQMEEALDDMTLSYQTGNAVTDVIVNRWMAEAKKQGVTFGASFQFREETIDAYDMAVILNNALENAVTAAVQSVQAGGKGFVHLRSFRKESLYFIETENDYTGIIEMDPVTELPRTTRNASDGSEHGLGLPNIRRCAESYLGAMDIVLSDPAHEPNHLNGLRAGGIFRLTVMLNTAARVNSKTR